MIIISLISDKFLVDSDVSRHRQTKAEPKELQKWDDGGEIQQSLSEMTLDSGSTVSLLLINIPLLRCHSQELTPFSIA